MRLEKIQCDAITLPVTLIDTADRIMIGSQFLDVAEDAAAPPVMMVMARR